MFADRMRLRYRCDTDLSTFKIYHNWLSPHVRSSEGYFKCLFPAAGGIFFPVYLESCPVTTVTVVTYYVMVVQML